MFVLACANPKGITGGAKDTIAPILLKQIPPNKTVNFNGRVIILEFDEWMKVANPQKEILITPSLKGTYEVKDYKKKIVIEFAENLEKNTTYTLNFRKALQDITEGNPAKNLQIVFSTGDFLDSLSLVGYAKNLLDNSAAEEASIWLSPSDDTLKVDKNLPYYLGQSDKNGFFRMDNLKEGTYWIYIFKDKNGNNVFNPEKGEQIGYMENPIRISAAKMDTLRIDLAPSDIRPPKIVRVRPSNTQLNRTFIDFSKGLEKIELKSSPQLSYQLGSNAKEVLVFNTADLKDSVNVEITAEDSLGNLLKTNKNIIFPKEIKNTKVQKEPLNLQVINKTEGEGMTTDLALELSFSKPIAQTDFQKIYFWKDKDSTQFIFLEKADYQWNTYTNKLLINKKIPFKEKINLVIDTMAFESVEKDFSKKMLQNYTLKNPTRFATMIVSLENNSASEVIVELLNEKKQVLRRKKMEGKQEKIIWSYISAGKYFLRAIEDANKNGKWDAGDYQTRKQPEKIVFLPKEIPLRENWEVNQEFIIKF